MPSPRGVWIRDAYRAVCDDAAAEGTAAGDAKKDAPGFTAVFVIAGILAVAYAMMRRRE